MKDWLIENLILAEPVDRPSELSHAECKQIAKEAAKPIAKMELGGDLLERSYSVETPQQLAVLLADCLQALPKPVEQPEPESDLLTVEQAAAKLGKVSPRTVQREIDDGKLRCIRVRGKVLVPIAAITDYIECQQQQGKSLFR